MKLGINAPFIIIPPLAIIFVGLLDVAGALPHGPDPSEPWCEQRQLVKEAVDVVVKNPSPLLGRLSVMQVYNERNYRVTADWHRDAIDGHPTCMADLVTNRGQMILYYGTEIINGQTYLRAQVLPNR